MKNCPKCGYELYDGAHFCPKCMYEYPRVEIKMTPSRSKKKPKYIVVLLLILFATLIVIWGNNTESDFTVSGENENQGSTPEIFMDEQTAIKNEDIEYDFRDDLTTYEEVKERLSVSPIVEFDVDDYGNVVSICLNYENADEASKKKYGIHGINGETTTDEVIAILGVPEQNYGETEYTYMFRGMAGMPSLIITFDDNGIVQDLLYYSH